MQLNVIIEIIDFIKNEIGSKQIISRYEQLMAVLKKISGNPDKDYSDELTEARNSVVQAQNEAEPSDWPYTKYRVFLELDKDCIIGKRAVANLESLFDSNQANPARMAKETKKIIDKIQKILDTNTGTLKILSSFSDSKAVNTGKTLLTLFFEGRTAVNTINDVERYSRIWDNIIRDFSILTMQNSCEPAVDSIDKNSMTLRIEDGDKILESLSYGTGKIIDTYSKILRIRKLQLEVVLMTLNPDINELFEEEISITINKTSSEVVKELMEINNWKDQHEKDEVFNSVQKSLKLILDFIEKGGKIECQLTKNTAEITERNKMLLTAYNLVSEIEETVKEINLNKPITEES